MKLRRAAVCVYWGFPWLWSLFDTQCRWKVFRQCEVACARSNESSGWRLYHSGCSGSCTRRYVCAYAFWGRRRPSSGSRIVSTGTASREPDEYAREYDECACPCVCRTGADKGHRGTVSLCQKRRHHASNHCAAFSKIESDVIEIVWVCVWWLIRIYTTSEHAAGVNLLSPFSLRFPSMANMTTGFTIDRRNKQTLSSLMYRGRVAVTSRRRQQARLRPYTSPLLLYKKVLLIGKR